MPKFPGQKKKCVKTDAKRNKNILIVPHHIVFLIKNYAERNLDSFFFTSKFQLLKKKHRRKKTFKAEKKNPLLNLNLIIFPNYFEVSVMLIPNPGKYITVKENYVPTSLTKSKATFLKKI